MTKEIPAAYTRTARMLKHYQRQAQFVAYRRTLQVIVRLVRADDLPSPFQSMARVDQVLLDMVQADNL